MSGHVRATAALDGAAGAVVILSPNPMHDTGGGQRSAQLASEFLARGFAVLFVSHGQVTETVDLGLAFSAPRLLEHGLRDISHGEGKKAMRAFVAHPGAFVITQLPVAEWLPVLSEAHRQGAIRVYDLIDEWDSELGYGWYRRRVERRVLAQSDVLIATAPLLARYLERRTRREVSLLPNAHNGRVFSRTGAHERPVDLPVGPTAMYVGSLWGGWMDWELLDGLARSLSEVNFVFIGDHRSEGKGLPANCRFLGLKAQTDLPQYLAHATVALLPWKDNAVTQATSPLKVYEYVAMGLRVASPPLEPLAGIPGVVSCAGPHAFAQAIREAVSVSVPPELRQRMIDFTAQQSWARRVDALLDLVNTARSSRTEPTLLSRIRATLGW